MELIPDWAPNIHPMLVHFPIAILSVAIFFDFVSFFLPKNKKWWNEEATAFLYGVGALTAIMVYFTGKWAAGSVDASPQAEDVMHMHAGWAWWTILFYGIYALARIIVTWWASKRNRLNYHVGFFLLSFIGMFFLYETGEHGAEMVFGYGLGTGALVEQPSAQMTESQHRGYESYNDGSVNWTIGEEASQTLENHFTFLEGEAKASVSTEGDQQVLTFQNPNGFFVTNHDSYSSMQMVLDIHPHEYKGDIILTHHVHDANNYSYLALHADGSAELGHVENSQPTTVEEGSYEREGMESLKLSVSGDHLKGYVNGEQILHGHAEQPGPGSVGLKLDGDGILGIRSIKITPVGEEEGHEEGEEAHHHHEDEDEHSH